MKIAIKYITALFISYTLLGSTISNAQCPEQFFWYGFLNLDLGYPSASDPGTQVFSFYFGKDHPLNGTYSSTNTYSSVHNAYIISFPLLEEPTSLNFIVYTQFGQCIYLEGKLCENCPNPLTFGTGSCIPFFSECGFDLLILLQNNSDEINCRQWKGNCDKNTDIYRLGNVGVGTESWPENADAKLIVKNGIITNKVKLEMCNQGNWCDYVFDQDYPLPSLEEIEQFIIANRRLPNTPSGSEIARIGHFELKEVTLNQLEKIEEITWHVIKLQKELDHLENRLTILGAEKQK